MNSFQQYVSDFGSPSWMLRQEVAHHTNNVFALIGEKSTLSDTIKQSIDCECDQILETSYSGLDGALTRLFGIHRSTINRLQQLEQNIIILPKIFQSLDNLSTIIKSVEDNKTLGEINNYPHYNHRSKIQKSKRLYGENPDPMLYPNYSDRIIKYITGVQSEIIDLIYDLESTIKIQSPIYQTIDEVVASIEQNSQQRENLILKFSSTKGSSEPLAIKLSRYGLG